MNYKPLPYPHTHRLVHSLKPLKRKKKKKKKKKKANHADLPSSGNLHLHEPNKP